MDMAVNPLLDRYLLVKSILSFPSRGLLYIFLMSFIQNIVAGGLCVCRDASGRRK